MTKEELAEKINGTEYTACWEDKYSDIAEQNGLLIISGCSDDLIEFCGAFREEVGGGEVWISRNGVVGDFETAKDQWVDESDVFEWVGKKKDSFKIRGSFTRKGWKFDMGDIPYSKFIIMEHGEVSDEGVVVDIRDLR